MQTRSQTIPLAKDAMPLRKPQPLSPTSGVVRHSKTKVELTQALERVPQAERITVALENEHTGLTTRTTWSRLAVAVALRKGSEKYGIYETLSGARRNGFGLVTRHPTLADMFVFVETAAEAAEVAP